MENRFDKQEAYKSNYSKKCYKYILHIQYWIHHIHFLKNAVVITNSENQSLRISLINNCYNTLVVSLVTDVCTNNSKLKVNLTFEKWEVRLHKQLEY